MPTKIFTILLTIVFASCSLPTVSQLESQSNNTNLEKSLKVSSSLKRFPVKKLYNIKSKRSEPVPKNKIPAFIHFWSSWCVSCKKELPELVRLSELYKGKIDFIFIAVSDRHENIINYLTRTNLPIVSYLDLDDSLVRKLSIESLPASLFVDSYGEILTVPDPADYSKQIDLVKGPREWLSEESLAVFKAVKAFE